MTATTPGYHLPSGSVQRPRSAYLNVTPRDGLVLHCAAMVRWSRAQRRKNARIHRTIRLLVRAASYLPLRVAAAVGALLGALAALLSWHDRAHAEQACGAALGLDAQDAA